ncbi:hypothetical protein Nepgr_030722 [Nepenthes gracilis]|uniref:rRNA biogenesis protein RRP36 n=1 Tax=Nepenthes gracilis TaxID=150966 RepID=A0AAD3TGW2_NEPGR|nr:hypothetical protein Nepgr_030722 [Nepenthes gracilis]
MKNIDLGMASSSKMEFDGREDSDSAPEEEAEIEHELADIPFEELQKGRSDGTLAFHPKLKLEKKSGRANKNRPVEMSSKRPVSRYREVVQVPKKMIRDPRFESLCGKLDVEGFKKRYTFLFDESLPAEKRELLKLLKSPNDPEVTEKVKGDISWIDKQLKSVSTKHTEAQILNEHKKKEREAAKKGKKPFYLKKSDIRKQRLIEKYNSLKASGKLDPFIEKKRKRNAAKDHRFMPYRRPQQHQQLF